MSSQPISLGRISVEPVEKWQFFPMENQIVARRDSRCGGVDITLGFIDAAPQVRSHIESLQLACQVLPEDLRGAKPYHFERISWAPRFCGGASFDGVHDFLRLWYVHEGTSLVPVLYACKLERSREPEAVREMIDSRRIAASIRILKP